MFLYKGTHVQSINEFGTGCENKTEVVKDEVKTKDKSKGNITYL